MEKQVGFIGLGNIGSHMAEHLMDKPERLVVYNRTHTKCEPFVKRGASMTRTIPELAGMVDVLFLSLPGPAEVEKTAATLMEYGNPGLVVLDTSTVSPKQNKELAAAFEKKGMTYIDMPISGGIAGAIKGTLSLLIGATEEEFDSLGLREITDRIGDKYFFMKQRGGGSAIKLINNFVAFTTQVINAEAIAMADALGISLDDFFDVTAQSTGNNHMLSTKKDKIKSGNYSPAFTTDLVVKDLEQARQLCQDYQVPNFSLNSALQFYRLAQAKGHSADDSSSVVAVIRSSYEKGELH